MIHCQPNNNMNQFTSEPSSVYLMMATQLWLCGYHDDVGRYNSFLPELILIYATLVI